MLPAEDLDAVLALQLTVAWAGEAQSRPPRLGWWRTDLVDRDGGAGLLADLLPRTWRWASLQGRPATSKPGSCPMAASSSPSPTHLSRSPGP